MLKEALWTQLLFVVYTDQFCDAGLDSANLPSEGLEGAESAVFTNVKIKIFGHDFHGGYKS